MHDHDTTRFIAILKESPLYVMLSTEEKQFLLERLAESYPSFEGDPDDQGSDNSL